MEWSDAGIVLSARRHGETSAVVSLLTAQHGRHAGLVRGGKAGRGQFETGNAVAARWRARLAEHLGHYTLELSHAPAARLLADPLRLSALVAVCTLCDAALAERQPYPKVFAGLAALLDEIAANGPWPEALVRWELALLAELGYGLDLSACAASGARRGLIYVSPRSGRAVSAEAGAPHKEKLLPLPRFLLEPERAERAEILAGLRLTGYFLARHVLEEKGARALLTRDRMVERLAR